MNLLCRLGFHDFKIIRDTVIHQYLRCEKCDKRKIARVVHGGHQAIDKGWLETGEWTPIGKPPICRPQKRRS